MLPSHGGDVTTQQMRLLTSLSTHPLSVIHSLFPQELLADGFRVLDHSASATGQGAAVSAQADDAAACPL